MLPNYLTSIIKKTNNNNSNNKHLSSSSSDASSTTGSSNLDSSHSHDEQHSFNKKPAIIRNKSTKIKLEKEILDKLYSMKSGDENELECRSSSSSSSGGRSSNGKQHTVTSQDSAISCNSSPNPKTDLHLTFSDNRLQKLYSIEDDYNRVKNLTETNYYLTFNSECLKSMKNQVPPSSSSPVSSSSENRIISKMSSFSSARSQSQATSFLSPANINMYGTPLSKTPSTKSNVIKYNFANSLKNTNSLKDSICEIKVQDDCESQHKEMRPVTTPTSSLQYTRSFKQQQSNQNLSNKAPLMDRIVVRVPSFKLLSEQKPHEHSFNNNNNSRLTGDENNLKTIDFLKTYLNHSDFINVNTNNQQSTTTTANSNNISNTLFNSYV
jgi:hypothetical protein